MDGLDDGLPDLDVNIQNIIQNSLRIYNRMAMAFRGGGGSVTDSLRMLLREMTIPTTIILGGDFSTSDMRLLGELIGRNTMTSLKLFGCSLPNKEDNGDDEDGAKFLFQQLRENTSLEKIALEPSDWCNWFPELFEALQHKPGRIELLASPGTTGGDDSIVGLCSLLKFLTAATVNGGVNPNPFYSFCSLGMIGYQWKDNPNLCEVLNEYLESLLAAVRDNYICIPPLPAAAEEQERPFEIILDRSLHRWLTIDNSQDDAEAEITTFIAHILDQLWMYHEMNKYGRKQLVQGGKSTKEDTVEMMVKLRDNLGCLHMILLENPTIVK